MCCEFVFGVFASAAGRFSLGKTGFGRKGRKFANSHFFENLKFEISEISILELKLEVEWLRARCRASTGAAGPRRSLCTFLSIFLVYG